MAKTEAASRSAPGLHRVQRRDVHDDQEQEERSRPPDLRKYCPRCGRHTPHREEQDLARSAAWGPATEGYSSVGRAAVSKTAGRRFEPCRPCPVLCVNRAGFTSLGGWDRPVSHHRLTLLGARVFHGLRRRIFTLFGTSSGGSSERRISQHPVSEAEARHDGRKAPSGSLITQAREHRHVVIRCLGRGRSTS